MWPFRKRDPGRGPGVVLPEHWGASYKALWDRFVPDSGQADTVQGELIRTAARVRSEYEGTGCMNWAEHHAFYQACCVFIRRHLEDGTFPKRTNAFVRETMERMVQVGGWYATRDALDEDDPELERMEEGEGPPDLPVELLHQIECLVELWCDAHPAPIPRPADAALDL